MEMEKKNVAIILLAIALVASGVGNIILGIMAGLIEPTAPEAEILTYVDTATPYVLDPVDCWDAYSGLIIEQSAEPLFTYNYSNNGQNIALIGALATSYTYDDSGAEAFYDITLRQGVTFHDGEPWNADAALWNIGRWEYWWNLTGLLPGTELPGYPEYVYHFADGQTPLWNRTQKLGEYSFRFYMNAPYVAFIDLLTYTAGSMLSPASVSNTTLLTFTDTIVGTGPFEFDYYDPGVETRFVRNDNYWGGATTWDEAVIVYFGDSVSMNSAMLGAQYDFMEGCLPDLIPQFRASPVVDYVNFTETFGDISLGYGYVGLNNPTIPLKIRKALNFATDHDYLVNEILEGVVVKAYTPVPSSFPGYEPAAGQDPYFNISHARRLMKNYDPVTFAGLDITYPGPDDAAWQAIAAAGTYNYSCWVYLPSQTYHDYFTAFSGWWDDIGIFLYMKETYWGTYINNMKSDPNWLDMWPIGWIPDYFNALNMLAPLFHPSSTADFTRVDNATVTGWMEAAFAETDPVVFNSLMSDIQLLLMDEIYPHIPLDYGQLFYVKVPELVVDNYNSMQRLIFADWYYAE
jgi:ABC-type transport system substrate-binding protein